jgi:SSS family solute:Na+ symporter
MSAAIGWADWTLVALYIVGIVTLGCWAGWRQRRRDKENAGGYFLAGRSLSWITIGAALFSTNISTVHLVSLAQEGYVNGLLYGNFEWMAAFTLIALSLFFAPFYIRSGVTTLPDFLERRYNRACRDWLAVLSIISAIFVHIGFSLYTGAVVLRGLLGIDIYPSIIAAAVLTGLYTIVGGLLAVVWTESLQTVVLLLGAISLTTIAYHHAGGWNGLTAVVDPVKLTVLRSAAEAPTLPWYAVLLGYPVIGLWYWCADQTIVQRVLGARDENHARLGPLFAGFLKILPVFIFVLPGLLCEALIRQGRLPSGLTDSADTYAFMVTHLLPVGLKGLVAAALLAALMSTVSGALNSIATLFCWDLYRRFRPATPERQLVTLGRWVTALAMIAGILWTPFIRRYQSIFQGINTVICYIAPPITTVFLFGVFWPRASGVAAQWTLYLGSALGFVVFLLDWFKDHTGWNIPFMLAAFYLFVVCSAILVVLSWIRPHKHTAESRRLVWNHPFESLRFEGRPGWGNYRRWALILFVTMVALYVVFA